MIGIPELLGYIILFIPMFLVHELCHIKACGIKAEGTIFVGVFDLCCKTEPCGNISWYGGGILSSIYMFVVVLIMPYNIFTFAFITLGWTNLIYGIFEGYYHGIGIKRYIIYILTAIIWGVMF